MSRFLLLCIGLQEEHEVFTGNNVRTGQRPGFVRAGTREEIWT